METKQIFLNVQRNQAERMLKRYSEHSEPRSDDQFTPVSFSLLDNPKFRNGLMTKKRFRTYLWVRRHVVRVGNIMIHAAYFKIIGLTVNWL